MYMSLKVLSRATLLHLSLNPLLSLAARASTSTSTIATATAFATTSPHLRSFSALYPLCPSYNLYQTTPSQAQSQSQSHIHNQEHPFSTSAPMSAESSTPSQPQSQPEKQEQEREQERNQNPPPLALPDVSSAEQVTQIDLSAGDSTVKLDALGPLVVNQDGSLSRIGNWAQMTEVEKRNTLRILGKRNQARLKALREAGVGDEGN
ncbi:uncharacterized protein ACLA_045540 [Aspergillus clavatus NRRL 1]|uniref:Fungal specific transcription factor n=1 Tax=Aspergillus clavatus (strain ATCC 1007 / CBS 513.65 / DSM 816 / NCTC 3887 / NRRL 1 / QM 1276 / 107) TaxID=344612 RepID=A1CGT4_ASPCL|nr:uncharacterized protein ACLA_045540 [Aspergillus clavatus NRRL 1]EAW10089.1 conserved hypothetical protein [Aspergillus clavatus NRRL 1]